MFIVTAGKKFLCQFQKPIRYKKSTVYDMVWTDTKKFIYDVDCLVGPTRKSDF
jgi:hypothetical protein